MVEAFGPVTRLVNGAGLVTMTGLDDLTEEEWDLVLDVNLKGYWLVTQEVARVMPEGSAIACISTVEADVVVSSTGSCQVHYNASKGGVKMLVKALAVELAATGTEPSFALDCGGRTPSVDPVDVLYSISTIGAWTGVDDGLSVDERPTTSEFPFLAPPDL